MLVRVEVDIDIDEPVAELWRQVNLGKPVTLLFDGIPLPGGLKPWNPRGEITGVVLANDPNPQ